MSLLSGNIDLGGIGDVGHRLPAEYNHDMILILEKKLEALTDYLGVEVEYIQEGYKVTKRRKK